MPWLGKTFPRGCPEEAQDVNLAMQSQLAWGAGPSSLCQQQEMERKTTDPAKKPTSLSALASVSQGGTEVSII